jgi:hypothetical protein
VAAISTGHPLRALSLVWSSMGHPSRAVLGTMRNHTRPQGRRRACAVAGPSSLHAKMKPTRRAFTTVLETGLVGCSLDLIGSWGPNLV